MPMCSYIRSRFPALSKDVPIFDVDLYVSSWQMPYHRIVDRNYTESLLRGVLQMPCLGWQASE
jgi:hypothetical protein